MDNVITKTKELIEVIDSSDLIKKMNYYKNRVLNNKNIMNMIDKYNNTSDDYVKLDIKRNIYKYEDYNMYMKYYNELFYYVLKINNMYKSFTSESGCK